MIRWLAIVLIWCLAVSLAVGAERLIRLAPLPENPPQADESGHRTWARLHQLGGIEEEANRAFIFLPVSVEYVRLLADEQKMPPEQLAMLGPWIDGFWVHCNVYQYAEGAPTDVSNRFSEATLELRWGSPTVGDTSIIPEPQESLTLRTPEAVASGLWFRAEFPDTATAVDFAEAPLRQLRMHDGETTYIFDLDPWLDLELFAPPSGPPSVGPPVPGPGPITPLPSN